MSITTISPTVDEEFRNLCPPLTEEERRLLRESILAEGCREKIVCLDATGYPILDGYNRHAICEGEGIDYECRLVKLAGREEAIDWIARNQLGRRNVSEEQRSYLRGKLYLARRGARGNPSFSSGNSQLGHSDPIGTTADAVASETGVSPKTVKRDAKFAAAVDDLAEKAPALAQAAREGTISKKDVPKLAAKTKGELERLAKNAGPKLREAAKKALDGPKPGAQKKDPRLWGEIEGLLGKALPRADELHKQFPHGILHRQLIADVKKAMATLKQWKGAMR